MRRPNRNIEIFSISALDLFASALGAFILVAIILFPYYLKEEKSADALKAAKEQLDAARKESALNGETLARQSAEVLATRANLARARERAVSLEQQVAKYESFVRKPFIVIMIRWSVPGADVDLHVTDPAGNEFYWFKTNQNHLDYTTSEGELSYDMTTGPGVEVWQDPSVVAGRYKIEYVANALTDGYAVDVAADVFDRGGIRKLQSKRLRKAGDRVMAALLDVNTEGVVAVQ